VNKDQKLLAEAYSDVQSVDQELMDVFMAIKYGEIDYRKFKAFVDAYIAKRVQ
jgi:hypothetical protein